MAKKAITRRDETFNTEKMMRYDDFTDEDVGNIVMDAEPLPEGCRIFQLKSLFHNTVSVFEYFCPKLSKSVQYDLWLFQLFLAFFNSLYQELSGYVSQISLVLHIYPQEVQEHRLFCSFAWKIRFLLLAQVGK